MIWLLVIISIFAILNARFSPRFNFIKDDPIYNRIILWYTIKSKYDEEVLRDWITIIKWKK